MRNYLKLGDWNAQCDVCGFKYKASHLKPRWDGLMVCHNDWETRHPSDFLRVQEEQVSVPWVRDESPDVFVGDTCNIWTSSPMADFGVADCMLVGGNTSIQVLIDIYPTYSEAGYAIAGYCIPGILHI